MCGISGLIGKREGAESVVKRVTEAQVHRGPDAEGIWAGEDIALGHRRLSIIDLSQAGRQPMSNEDGTIWMVFNGEIYNFLDLRGKLQRKGHKFRSRTDCEVVLHLYEEVGERCVERLRGMFAFAIWDGKRRKALLARDRLGIKPLYYWTDGGIFAFASEVKALLASGLVPKRVNFDALLGYIVLGSVPAPLTIVEGVKALPAGHYMVVEGGKFKVKRYWEVDFSEKEPMGEGEVLERLRELLKESVRVRLVSDVPLGAFLSGGIDSSAVVALMSLAGGVVRTFNITFPEAEFSEARYARLVAEKFSTEHHECEVTGEDVAREMPRIIKAMDQPTVDGVNTYFVSKFTRESGTIVALSGVGGDEVFCGYSHFRSVPRMLKVLRLLAKVPRPGRGLVSLVLSALGDRWEKAAKALEGNGTVEEAYLARRAILWGRALERLLSREVRERAQFRPLEYLEGFGRDGEGAIEDRLSFLEMKTYLHNQLLRDTDFMSMAHSLEVRVPLLDHLLVEFVAKVPANLKVGPDAPKRLLVKALGDLLPREVVYRPKRTFTFPFAIWVRKQLRPLVEEALISDKIVGRWGFFNPSALKRLWEEFLRGRVHWSRVWAPAVLHLWCEEHLG